MNGLFLFSFTYVFFCLFIIQPPLLSIEASQQDTMSRVTKFLMAENRICSSFTRCKKHQRNVLVNVNSMFESLVTLYSSMFIIQWPHFECFMEAHLLPNAVIKPWTYAARVYISMWFHDTYVTIREIVQKIAPQAFLQHYYHDEVLASIEYDEFLVRLNAAIRPTNIVGTPEDTLYIPYLHSNPQWENTQNPFCITDGVQDFDCFFGMISIMKDRKCGRWISSSLTRLGGPRGYSTGTPRPNVSPGSPLKATTLWMM